MRRRLARAGRLFRAARGSANHIVTLGTHRARTVAKGGWGVTSATLEPLVEAALAGDATRSRSGDRAPVGAPAEPVPARIPPTRRGRSMSKTKTKTKRSGTAGSGERASLMVASLAAGVAAGLAAALVSRRRRHRNQWQQFEPATGQSIVDGFGATVVVPVEEPSKPA